MALVAPDGITEFPTPNIPVELFLYQKMNNILPADGTPAVEPLLSGTFGRCAEPDDFDPNNPTLFGKEQLIWVRDPWAYTGTNQLAAAGDALGAPLTLASAEAPYSPANTKNTTGYYVSRVHQARTLDPNGADAIRDQMIVACRAFAAKYNAQMRILFEQQQTSAWINEGIGV